MSVNDTRPTHIDLFSGIGGFSLALQREGFRTIGHSEVEPFPCAVYHHHFQESKCYGDIRHITKDRIFQQSNIAKIGVITAGFPCQPFSCAGKRNGNKDERHLWPKLAEIVCDTRPNFCLFENVAGLLSVPSTGCLHGGDFGRRRLHWNRQISKAIADSVSSKSGGLYVGKSESCYSLDSIGIRREHLPKSGLEAGSECAMLALEYSRGLGGDFSHENCPIFITQTGSSQNNFTVRGVDWAEAEMWEACLDSENVSQRGDALPENQKVECTWAGSEHDLDDGPETTGWVFGDILRDISQAGYACLWQVVSAADIGAPHRRERVWMLCVDEMAHANHAGCREHGERLTTESEQLASEYNGHAWPSRPGQPKHGWEPSRVVAGAKDIAAGQRTEMGKSEPEQEPKRSSEGNSEQRQAEPSLGSLPNGIPSAMVRAWPQVQNRVGQLKAYGNSIVPAVAQIFARAIRKKL